MTSAAAFQVATLLNSPRQLMWACRGDDESVVPQAPGTMTHLDGFCKHFANLSVSILSTGSRKAEGWDS